MKVYDRITTSNEYMDMPAWIAVNLSQTDEDNIIKSREMIMAHPFLRSMNINLDGKWDMEETEGKWRGGGLHVSQHSVIFSVHNEWAGGTIEVVLDDEPSNEWVWNPATDTVEALA